MGSEGSLPLAPDGALPSYPEGDKTVDNDNGTALDQHRRNRRDPTQYNPQCNVPASQWVPDQHASVSRFVIDSSLYVTFSMDSWG